MNETTSNRPKFVRWALLIGIVVILNVFFSVLVSIVFPEPTYEAFCPTQQVQPSYGSQESCIAAGGQWSDTPSPKVAGTPLGYCDPQYTCRIKYTDALQSHAKDAFIAYVVLGVLVLIAGLIPMGSSIVSSGLSYGGVIALIIGSGQYWGTAGKWIRLAIAVAGLIALLYVGIRRFKD